MKEQVKYRCWEHELGGFRECIMHALRTGRRLPLPRRLHGRRGQSCRPPFHTLKLKELY